MANLLMTVQDKFDIPSFGGVVVVPGPLIESHSQRREVEVTLKRSGAADLKAVLRIGEIFQTPPPKERRWGFILLNIDVSDVPIGTEIWVEGDLKL